MLKTMLDGMGGTCAIFFLTLLFALPLGMVVALLRMSKVKVISSITRAIISVLRGTPLMLQLIAVTYGPYYLFELPVAKNKLVPVVIAFAINYAAYFAEIYRGGIESIPRGHSGLFQNSDLLPHNSSAGAQAHHAERHKRGRYPR